MNQWLKRFRGAVLLGSAWAVVWAPVAVLLGVFIIDTDNSMDEMWPVIGAAVVGSIALLSAMSAVGSVLLARMAKNRELRGPARAWPR